jgi:molybdate transport system ATP-binding protein
VSGVVEIDLTLPLPRFALGVRVTLPAGVTAILGPSGAGKTSLLESVAGLRGAASGRVTVGGETLLDTARGVVLPPERRRVGYVPQDSGLFPHLSVLGNVRFGARADHGAVEAAIDTLEIRPLLDRRPLTLSGGERQRVALARALATRPRLLLLDEPLAALDVRLRERVLPWLLRVRDEWSLPCLYVTHNVGEALVAASHLVVMRDGRVEAAGEPRALLGAPALAAEAEAGIENLLPGCVVSHDEAGGITRVRTEAGLDVAVTLSAERPVGTAVTLAIERTGVDVTLGSPGLARGEEPLDLSSGGCRSSPLTHRGLHENERVGGYFCRIWLSGPWSATESSGPTTARQPLASGMNRRSRPSASFSQPKTFRATRHPVVWSMVTPLTTRPFSTLSRIRRRAAPTTLSPSVAGWIGSPNVQRLRVTRSVVPPGSYDGSKGSRKNRPSPSEYGSFGTTRPWFPDTSIALSCEGGPSRFCCTCTPRVSTSQRFATMVTCERSASATSTAMEVT